MRSVGRGADGTRAGTVRPWRSARSSIRTPSRSNGTGASPPRGTRRSASIPSGRREHLLLVALARCSHRRAPLPRDRQSLDLDGTAHASGAVGQARATAPGASSRSRAGPTSSSLPEPDEEALQELLEKAERGCFIGGSLRPKPVYAWTVNGREVRLGVATTAFDVEAVRARFSALRQPLAFFDAPGGTQVPGRGRRRRGRATTESRTRTPAARSPRAAPRTRSSTDARLAAAAFLGCGHDEVAFGANMTTLNFALTRAFARELAARRRDPRHEARPRRERLALAPARRRPRPPRPVRRRPRRHDARPRRPRRGGSRRGRGSSPSRGPRTPSARCRTWPRIAALAHEAGALAWVDAVHYAPHGPIDVEAVGRGRAALLAVQVLRPAPRGRVRARASCSRPGGRTRCGPRRTTPLGRAVRDGDGAVRAARRVRRRGRLPRLARLGRDRRARAGARAAVPRRAPRAVHAPRPADDGRPRPHVRAQRRRDAGRGGRDRARRARLRGLARRLLRRRDHAPARPRARGSRPRRDRPLQHARTRSTGSSRRSGRCEAPRPRRDEVPRPRDRRGGARPRPRGDDVHAGRDEPRPLPRGRAASRRPRRRSLGARGAHVGRGARHLRLRPARRQRLGRAAARRRASTSSSRRSPCTRSRSGPATTRRRPCRSSRTASRRTSSRDYGALKAACERVVEEVFGDRAAQLRFGLIVGPHDPTDRFTYWADRRRARRRGARPRRARSGRGSSWTCATVRRSRWTSPSGASSARSTSRTRRRPARCSRARP